MKRTLKRESKVSEIVASDAFVVSVCLIFNFFPNCLFCNVPFFLKKKESKVNFGASQVENGGLTSAMRIKFNIAREESNLFFCILCISSTDAFQVWAFLLFS